MELAKPKILLVDDQRDHLLLIESILGRLNAEVHSAVSGEEALRAAAENDYALILLDIQMPGMDGFEVAAKLSSDKKTKSAPLIFVTSADDPEIVHRGYCAGAVDYIEKPLDPDVLQYKVKVFLELYRQRVALAAEIQVRRSIEQNLQDAQELLQERNSELSEFAHLAAHDLKSPLHTIHGFAHRIKDKIGTAEPERIREWAEALVSGANRMSMMVDGLLDYAKAGLAGGNYEVIDLSKTCIHVREFLESKIFDSGAQVSFSELPEIYGNRAALTQLLLNLVSNAIKFRGDNAPIVSVSAERDGEYWRFACADNGIGIDPENFDKIFAPLHRLHSHEYEGTGLGLAACKKIVEAHHGTVWIESVVGVGSTFFFTLPTKIPADEPAVV